jgi:hypothetical protein
MIPSQQPLLLLLYFAKPSIATANIIQANALNFNFHPTNPPPNITMRPTLKLRAPTFPETTTIPPPPAQLLQQNSACNLVGQAIAICNTLTPSFNTLQPTAQAHCLCYSSTSWRPSIFDNAVKTCADYAFTAAPGAYNPLANLEGFCQGIGDVNQQDVPTPVFSLTTMYQSIQSSGMSMSISMSAFSGQPCNAVNSMLIDCSSSFNGFWSLQPSDRAKCLCYVSASSWCPTAFDNAVQTCEAFAMTAAPSVYAAVSSLGGFCASVGDVLATPTAPASYSVATTLSAVASPTPTPGPNSTKGSSSGNGGATSTTDIETTITIGGTRGTQTANSGGVKLERMSEGQVVAFSFLCALLVLFL